MVAQSWLRSATGARRARHSTAPSSIAGKSNPLLELLISVVIPSVILIKFSGEQDLGAVRALLLALAFPLTWGAADLLRKLAGLKLTEVLNH